MAKYQGIPFDSDDAIFSPPLPIHSPQMRQSSFEAPNGKLKEHSEHVIPPDLQVGIPLFIFETYVNR